MSTLLLWSVLVFAPQVQPTSFAPAIADLTAAIEAEMADNDLPGVSIAIVDGAHLVWSAGFGVADPRTGALASATTPYRVASISKLFTATGVMRFVERGALDLDAPVTEGEGAVRPRGLGEGAITLRQLLSHTAGLVREPSVGHYFDLAPPGLGDVVGSLRDTDLVTTPGTAFRYSNAGVAWAGHVLATAAGAPFEKVMQTEILGPLGLEHASFSGRGRTDVARGRMWTYDGRDVPTPVEDLGLGPAANLCASVEDLTRFAQTWFLGEHRGRYALLREGTLRAMFAPGTTAPQIGVSFFLDRLDGHLRVGHGGAYYAAATQVSALPEAGIAVAVAVNVDFASGPCDRLVDRALRHVLALRADKRGPAPDVRAGKVGSEAAWALAGHYRSDDERGELLEHDGDLWWRPTSGLWARLRQGDATGEFLAADRTHQALAAVVRDGAFEIGRRRYVREKDAPPAPCPAELLPYLGEYGWDHDTLLVFERDGHLSILIEWLAEYPLFAEDAPAGTFALDPTRGLYHGEQVTFARGDDGAVRGVRVGAVWFERRPLLGVDGGVFRIQARHSPERLRELAKQARAPKPPPGAREFDLVELKDAVPGIRYDIRYAGNDNFLGFPLYDHANARLQRPAADALLRVQRALAPQGLGLLAHDAYRPWEVTKMFWDATPEAQHHFVANPERGSRHNRGCAIDLTLCDLATGKPIPMPSLYDEFTARAYPNYPGGTSRERYFRDRLRREMGKAGFAVYEFEWWHFDHADWKEYPVR